MEIGRCMAVLVTVAAAAMLSSSLSAEAGLGARRPCFEACFDQCVPRDDFRFCQLSCYHRCGGVGCERSCVRSLCGRLHPGSKMMAACRDTCRQSYAAVACSHSTQIV
ncbi:hypothetical protein EJB05_16201, partial [Eragrostis curvula]